jgi:hypothetical protein
MPTSYKPFQRILAIDPRRYGFGWAVLEGEDLLVDWGMRDHATKITERVLAHVAVLIQRYAPHVIVVENTRNHRCLRRKRARALIREIALLAPHTEVRLVRVSAARIHQHFLALGAKNKDAVARIIADRFPELESLVPPRRKMWLPERDRMAVFDAVAMALVAAIATSPSDASQTIGSRMRHLIRRARASSKREP